MYQSHMSPQCFRHQSKKLLDIGDINTSFARGGRALNRHEDARDHGLDFGDITGPVVDYGSLHSISIGSSTRLGHGSFYQFESTRASF